MTTATAAIANHLNVNESAIVRVEEWANVLFAVVKGIGARFVSKKIVENAMTQYQMKNSAGEWEDLSNEKLMTLAQKAFNTFAGRYSSVQDVVEKIPAGRVYYDTEWYASLRIKPEPRKPCIVPAQTMTTSTGRVVDADEWDRMEGLV